MVNPCENSKNCRLQFSIASPQLGTSSEHPDASLDVYRTQRWSHKPPPHRHRSAFPTWLPLITMITHWHSCFQSTFIIHQNWSLDCSFRKRFLYQHEAQHFMLSVYLYVWHFCDAGLTKLTKWLGSSMMSGICQNLPYMHGLWTQLTTILAKTPKSHRQPAVARVVCHFPSDANIIRKGNNWNNQRPS